MPMTGFISAKDPKWLSTIRSIEKELVSDSLVYRYRIFSGAYCNSVNGKIRRAQHGVLRVGTT